MSFTPVNKWQIVWRIFWQILQYWACIVGLKERLECVSANSQSGLYAIFCGQHPCFLLINILWFLWLTLMFSPQETQFFGAPSHQELEPRMINNDFVRVCLLVCFCSCLSVFVCFWVIFVWCNTNFGVLSSVHICHLSKAQFLCWCWFLCESV